MKPMISFLDGFQADVITRDDAKPDDNADVDPETVALVDRVMRR